MIYSKLRLLYDNCFISLFPRLLPHLEKLIAMLKYLRIVTQTLHIAPIRRQIDEFNPPFLSNKIWLSLPERQLEIKIKISKDYKAFSLHLYMYNVFTYLWGCLLFVTLWCLYKLFRRLSWMYIKCNWISFKCSRRA